MRQRPGLVWPAVYATAMAFVESAVVVYLRAIYYPDGFAFPIVLIADRMALIEIGREAATLTMLLSVAWLAGRDRWERFLLFCFMFGVWDILYYVWLWAFLGWPSSLLTWDILFLIPVPWIGPVLAPVLVSLALIAGSVALLRAKARGAVLRFARWHWTLAIAGGLLVLLSFMIDHRVVVEGLIPHPFRWGLFLSGLAIAVAATLLGARSMGLLAPSGVSRAGGGSAPP